VVGNDIHLSWMTVTETNNYGFYVERTLSSSDYRNVKWENVSYIKSAGNSTETRSYSFTDENVDPGTYVYRLRIVDNDGSFTYSDAVSAEVEAPAKYSLEQNYPNPFNPSTTIAFTIPEASFVTLKIYNALGKEIAVLFSGNKEAGTYEMNYDAADIPSGIYYYTMYTNNYTQTNKMLLLK